MGLRVRGFLREESGATVIEYAILAAIISIAAIVVIAAIGSNVEAQFTEVKRLIESGRQGGS